MFRFYIRNVFRSNLKNNRKTIYPFYHNSQQVTSRYIKQEYYLPAFAASLPLNAVGGTLFSSINVVPPSDSFSEILPVISKAHVSGTVNADWPAFSTVSRLAKCCWPTSTILPLLRRRNVEAKCFFLNLSLTMILSITYLDFISLYANVLAEGLVTTIFCFSSGVTSMDLLNKSL